MKTLILAAALSLATFGAQAQTWNMQPNAYGGYTAHDQFGQQLFTSQPNAYGGYTFHDQFGGQLGYSQPNAYGGYTFHNGYGY